MHTLLITQRYAEIAEGLFRDVEDPGAVCDGVPFLVAAGD
jgi:hypothetical protein